MFYNMKAFSYLQDFFIKWQTLCLKILTKHYLLIYFHAEKNQSFIMIIKFIFCGSCLYKPFWSNCFMEVRRTSGKDCPLEMVDFMFGNDSYADVLRILLSLNKTQVKSSCFLTFISNVDKIQCLEHLNICRVSSADIVKFTQCT